MIKENLSWYSAQLLILSDELLECSNLTDELSQTQSSKIFNGCGITCAIKSGLYDTAHNIFGLTAVGTALLGAGIHLLDKAISE